MTSNSDAENFLNYYLDPENKFDFAILLDGPWGSGKTHFIKAFLKARKRPVDEGQAQNTAPTFLYSTLNGITSPDEITEQFFVQTHPTLNSKTARVFGSLVSGVARRWTGAELAEGGKNSKAIEDIFLKIEDQVLVFDDLERCSMPIADTMGFINNYVEHQHLKVIIIASQNDIPEEQKQEYGRKKEKLIGKTLLVGSDPSDVYELLAQKLKNPTVKRIVLESKLIVLNTFASSGKKNFRSLRAVLDDYDRLISAVDKRLQKNDDALVDLLLYIVATGLEFREGTLGSEDISSLSSSMKQLQTDHLLSKPLSDENMKSDTLKSKYPDVRWRDSIVPTDSLAKLYSAGIVEVEKINFHLAIHPMIVGYKSVPAWRQLWNWDDLTRSRYNKARETLIKQLNTHQLTHPGEILHAMGEVVVLSENGDEFLGPTTDIEKYFDSYLESLLAKNRLQPARGLFYPFEGSYASLGYQGSHNELFKRLKEKVRVATFKAFSNLLKASAKDLMKRIKSGSELGHLALHEYDVDKKYYADAAILQYLNVSDFADEIIVDSKPNNSLLSALFVRYQHDASKMLKDEYPWIEQLHEELKSRIKSETPPYQKMLEGRIEYYFKNIREVTTP